MKNIRLETAKQVYVEEICSAADKFAERAMDEAELSQMLQAAQAYSDDILRRAVAIQAKIRGFDDLGRKTHLQAYLSWEI